MAFNAIGEKIAIVAGGRSKLVMVLTEYWFFLSHFIERAVEFGFINAPWLSQYEPFLVSLRSEPRFGRLMEGVRTAWRAFEP